METPHAIGIAVNNHCNLRCQHCYLQYRSLAPLLSQCELEHVLDQVIALPDTRLVSLVGMEPLLGNNGPAMLTRLSNRPKGIMAGIITNGILLDRYLDLLRATRLSHINISIDGNRQDHDAVRGTGNFDKTLSSIVWCLREMPTTQMVVGLTIQRRNVTRFGEAVQIVHDMGAEIMDAAFYTPTSVSNFRELTLDAGDIKMFFTTLEELGQVQISHPIRLEVEVGINMPTGLLEFCDSQWCVPSEWQVTDNNYLYNEHKLKNGLTLAFLITPWPQPFRSVVRITAEGLVLHGDDVLDVSTYRQHALADLRDFGLDVGATFAAAEESPRHQEVLVEWQSTVLPQLRKTKAAKRISDYLKRA